jgi:hypothetical protein
MTQVLHLRGDVFLFEAAQEAVGADVERQRRWDRGDALGMLSPFAAGVALGITPPHAPGDVCPYSTG